MKFKHSTKGYLNIFDAIARKQMFDAVIKNAKKTKPDLDETKARTALGKAAEKSMGRGYNGDDSCVANAACGEYYAVTSQFEARLYIKIPLGEYIYKY